MPSAPDPKRLSCIPCAKRKVRCDRNAPCANCKRRKSDVCVYPTERLGSRQAAMAELSEQWCDDRVQKLEAYIKRLGGDPANAEESHNSHNGAQRRDATSNSGSVGRLTLPRSPEHDRGSVSARKEPGGLVEHDKQTTYVEAPMWFSWSEPQPSDRDAPHFPQQLLESQAQSTKPVAFHTLVELDNSVSSSSLSDKHPTASQVIMLWEKYLTNVHPLVKIFFAWDKELLMQKASRNPESLSSGEHALAFAVYFISILSLSNEECCNELASQKPVLLNHFQSLLEASLHNAGFIATSDCLVLQAFMLYLLAMRNRARSAAIFSLMGVAVRIAQRIGLHRDGDILGLPVMQAEERRRMWWQLQNMEIIISQLVGTISLTLHANWDTKLPANLEDDDIQKNTAIRPPDRPGLTSLSFCYWRYYIIHLQRTRTNADGTPEGWAWITMLPLEEKKMKIAQVENALNEKFLQYCELLNPLHVLIMIGIRAFILAFQRTALQPGVANVSISKMAPREREEFLGICTKCLEYYVLGETTASLKPFQWHNVNYFQWTAFAYVIIEAHSRAEEPAVDDLWNLINKVCELHPTLTTVMHRPETAAIGRLLVHAWARREAHLKRSQKQMHKSILSIERPWYINELHQKLHIDPGIPETPTHRHQTDVPFAGFDWDEATLPSLEDLLSMELGLTLPLFLAAEEGVDVPMV